MLLVSGVIEGEKGTILRRSQAKIIAETNRELEVRVPLKETRLLPTGRTIFRPTLNFFTLSIPCIPTAPSTASIPWRNRASADGRRPAHATLHHQPPVYSHGTCRDRPNRAGGRRAGRKAARPKGAGGAGQRRITASQYQGETAGGYYVLRGAYQCIEDIGVEEQILLD